MSPARRGAVLAVTAASCLILAGCSQIAALKQVSGVPITTLTIAANDVLVAQRVPVLEAPKCRLDSAANKYQCSGSTLSGSKIDVTAPDQENLIMTIKVGGKEIFSGGVQDVIESNQLGAK